LTHALVFAMTKPNVISETPVRSQESRVRSLA
jgi:hypothetical protein